MIQPIRILCVGAGNMGRSHALAYHKLDEFEIVGICTRSENSRKSLLDELASDYPGFNDYYAALKRIQPDAVSISSYPDTHMAYTKAALEAGCHVFLEKPISETVSEAAELIELAHKKKLKLVAGYILRYHPSWQQFIQVSHTLGKPLVMRMNMNQQSSGSQWKTHQSLLSSISPIVDCGVHYVDVMCQMTQAKAIRVSGLGARLSNDIPEDKINYGHLQVSFDDGSVGWYEAGWGPMMSETAFFIKDVIGPDGSASIIASKASEPGQSTNVQGHVETQVIHRHNSALSTDGTFLKPDEQISTDEEPNHDELCQLEQEYFLRSIREDLDLSDQYAEILSSMRIVAAADESFRTGKTIDL
ncbi:Gfo/Idh/MocA family protein [Coraliomargarita sp. W4R72]